MKTKKKLKSITQLKKKLDEVYSIYIRHRGADDFGMNTCVTCGRKLHWKDLQNGHFVSRSHLILRWSDNNCHPQCCSCNVFKSGNMVEYAVYMEKTYGQGIIQQLNQEKQKTFKLERKWLEEKINYYKNL